MTTAISPQHLERVLKFWFGDLDEEGRSDQAHIEAWFKKDPDFDEQIRKEFGWLHACLLAAAVNDSALFSNANEQHSLAAVIVLDQYSRNMYRDTPGMFAADAVGLAYSYGLVAQGLDKKLPLSMRSFAYMPFMHSERLVDQERCIELFENFASELEGDAQKRIQGNVNYAVKHRDIVARFGRFPHRNKILGRTSTAEEERFLTQPGSSF